MKENILQIVAAVLLGLALPGLLIRLGPKADFDVQTPETTAPTQPQTEETKTGIWVLGDDGQLQWMILDEYLTGVILAEMPTSYEHHALCAQAVVARTYALKRQHDSRHPQGAVCTDPACCQAHVEIGRYLNGLGFAQDVEAARSAVTETQGMVVTYDGTLIEATYFHSSGGTTEEAVAVWGVDYPYLQVVSSPGEEKVEDYSTEFRFTRTQLETMLGRSLPGPASGWLGKMTYTNGGGVATILLAGIQYTGLQLRSMLKLNSTVFSVRAEQDGVVFTTRGRGHRVGMSQTGAQAMALQGNTWQEILSHYYPGTRIDKMEVVG